MTLQDVACNLMKLLAYPLLFLQYVSWFFVILANHQLHKSFRQSLDVRSLAHLTHQTSLLAPLCALLQAEKESSISYLVEVAIHDLPFAKRSGLPKWSGDLGTVDHQYEQIINAYNHEFQLQFQL